MARSLVLRAGMRFGGRSLLTLAAVNVGVLLVLLVPVELIFGTWIRPMGVTDLKRFSIPVGISFEFDASTLYGDGSPQFIRYSRDDWGLRGSHQSLEAIEVLTIGGSTTEQRYLDDVATWQALAQEELSRMGSGHVIANAGVDGQSTVGHLFDFDFWFPLLPQLRPRVIVFYIGANDVLRHDRRPEFDATVDATAWRTKSVTFQLLRTIRNNIRARSVGVTHGRRRELAVQDFTVHGLLSDAQRADLADAVTSGVLRNVELLRQRSEAMGAVPVFMTQTALAWDANPDQPSRGLSETLSIYGGKVNYADVSYLHQQLNRRLIEYCRSRGVTCFDLARKVTFDTGDYYDYLHNTPSGAAKIARFVAEQLLALDKAGAASP